MATTTIRIEDDLKARVAIVAERKGQTAHAFMLEAIAQTVAQIEQDDDFHRTADARWTRLLSTGKTVAWDQAQAYLQARASGRNARKPAARKR